MSELAPKLKPKFKLQIIFSLIILLSVSFGLAFALARPPADPSFSFVVFGDNQGSKEIFDQLLARLNQETDLAFAVNLGDCVVNGTEPEYQLYLSQLSKLQPKVYQVPGNHDLVNHGDRYFKKYFGPLYYSFNYQNSHFIVLNNAFRGMFNATQLNWLKADLAQNKQAHCFVFFHRPLFDPLELYDDYVMSEHEVVAELKSLFARYRVEYVCAGHIHGYAGRREGGVVYLVSGGAGGVLHLPAGLGGFYHYVKITVAGEKITEEVVKL